MDRTTVKRSEPAVIVVDCGHKLQAPHTNTNIIAHCLHSSILIKSINEPQSISSECK